MRMILSDNMSTFLEEMHKRIEDDYAEFCMYQSRMQETLAVFHDICLKNNLTYYLAYGSLLGAIRNNGQIPWDYDIDVWMPYEQAQQTIAALDRDLPEGFHYITRLKEKKYRTYTLKLAPIEYDWEVLHVDVFWLVGGHKDLKARQKAHRTLASYKNAMLYKYCDRRYLGISGRVSELIYLLRKFRYACYPKAVLESTFKRLMSVSCAKSDLWVDNAEPHEFRKVWFGQPKFIKLANGHELCVPQDSESILTEIYGNYEQPPSIESRMEEFLASLTRIRKLSVCKAPIAIRQDPTEGSF